MIWKGSTHDNLCGLVVRAPGYRSRGPGSISGATRFSERFCIWNGVHSASKVQLRSYLKEKNRGSDLENRDYGRRDQPRCPRDTPLSINVGTNFADEWRSLSRYEYSSLAD
jgi:hypothetical protein